VAGNYDTYLHLVGQGLIPNPLDAARGENERENRPKRPERDRPARPKRKFPYRKVADLETDIQTCESRINALHQALAAPDLRDGQRIKELKAELDAQQNQLEQLLAHWEEASELN
jgi:ATP-binding cassette, subfamily F, member 3